MNAANRRPFHGGGRKSTLESTGLLTITDVYVVTGVIHGAAGRNLDIDCELFSSQENRRLEPSHCLATDGLSSSLNICYCASNPSLAYRLRESHTWDDSTKAIQCTRIFDCEIYLEMGLHGK